MEDDDLRETKYKENLILAIPIGALLGGFCGLLNQLLRGNGIASRQTEKERLITSEDNQL